MLQMDNKQKAEFCSKLEKRRTELEELREMSASGRDPVELDQQSVGRVSRVDAMQRQAMAQEQERKRGAELIRIEHALNRIKDGEFGFCLNCGENIPLQRLDIDPAIMVCVRCASNY